MAKPVRETVREGRRSIQTPPNFQDPKFWEGKTDESLTKIIKEGGASAGRPSSPGDAPQQR